MNYYTFKALANGPVMSWVHWITCAYFRLLQTKINSSVRIWQTPPPLLRTSFTDDPLIHYKALKQLQQSLSQACKQGYMASKGFYLYDSYYTGNLDRSIRASTLKNMLW